MFWSFEDSYRKTMASSTAMRIVCIANISRSVDLKQNWNKIRDLFPSDRDD